VKRPLFFISGWGATEKVWDPLLKDLGNDFPPFRISWHECLKNGNLLEKSVKMSSHAVVLVGWSLGGLIALQTAVSMPQKVSGLCLISATSRMVEDDNYAGVPEKALKAMVLKFKRKPGVVIEDFSENCFHPQSDQALRNLFGDMAESFTHQSMTQGLGFLKETDLRSSLPEIEVPTLILHGENDRIIPTGQAHFLGNRVPNSSLAILEDAGHALPLTHPSWLAGQIKVFLNG
jgi:pimeloyl-[acyl-carrier protein] methyl ester esterase